MIQQRITRINLRIAIVYLKMFVVISRYIERRRLHKILLDAIRPVPVPKNRIEMTEEEQEQAIDTINKLLEIQGRELKE